MKWTEEQYTAINVRGKRVLVSAAAGSGKTAVLVERVLLRITRENSPDSLDDLVILTFTNAAASEMRSRISEAIGAALAASPSNKHLRGQLNRVQTARIMTIHAFCAKLARENFHVLGINPEFRIISGEEEESLKRETLAEYLETQYASALESSPFWELADSSSGARDDKGLWELIFSINRVLGNSSDPRGLAESFSNMASVPGGTDAAETVWGRLFLSDMSDSLKYAAALYERCEYLARNYGLSQKVADVLAGENDSVRNLAAIKGSWDEIRESILSGVKFATLRFAKDDDERIKEEIKALRNSAKDIVKSFSEGILRFGNEKILSDINSNALLSRELLRLCVEFSEQWQNKKKEMGVLGFDDLEHCALNILSVKENGKLRPSDFALEYGGRIREIMVDEYQDTNGIQDDIFECLSAGGAELFVVGDVKQSIYRFRSAEPDIFLRRRNEGVLTENIPLGAGETRLSKENNTVIMQRNFRSLPEVTDTVNSVFRKLMVRDFAEMDYLPGDELVACRDGGDESNTAELVFIKGERSEDDEDGGQSSSAREREAAWIAKRVSSMLSGGVTVFDKSVGGKRLLRPGDIAVLVRSAKRRVSVLAEAFAAEGIPVSADAGGDIFGSAEVNAVMSMLSAVDNPGRELALAGYLRSPLVGFSAEELGRIKICSGGSFYASLKLCAEGVGETAEKCRSVLKELEKMRLAASDLDVGRAVGMLLDMSGAYVVFGSMDGGITRRANLNLIVGLASSYSERGGRDLGGFVRSLERSRDHGDEFPAPKVAGDGVRIMTVHASKGLEFPVVFLANSMEKANISWKRENVMVHKDCGLGMLYSDAGSFVRHTTLPREAAAIRISEQQLAEELRLLYVAMTRAREKLIVTGSCDDLDALAAEVRNDGSESWIKGICSRKPSFGRWLFAVANCGEEIP
ncbi:MAG: UvrD-helicase domain-containing protein, partial [Clostridia bacterium]|nr:UvrD-helicase domain-containing protein [Clostridia bacterium]